MGSNTCNRLRFLNRTTVFYFIYVLFFCSCALLSTVNSKTPLSDIKSFSSNNVDFHDQDHQEFKKTSEKVKSEEIVPISMARRAGRVLRGPGFAPPNCKGKCGMCTPCKPVLVPVNPEGPDYYPEVWKCKCPGN